MYTGWWYTYPSEKYEFVSWDDDIPNILWKIIIFMFQNTNQYIYNIYNNIYIYCVIPSHPILAVTQNPAWEPKMKRTNTQSQNLWVCHITIE
jgi:hypothetical protein